MKSLLRPRQVVVAYVLVAGVLVGAAIVFGSTEVSFAIVGLAVVGAVFVAAAFVMPLLYEARTVQRNLIVRDQQISEKLREIAADMEYSRAQAEASLQKSCKLALERQELLISRLENALAAQSAGQRELAGALTTQTVQLEAVLVLLRRRSNRGVGDLQKGGAGR